MKNTVEIHRLTKRYREVVAVSSLSLSIAEGELFSLLGVNGAGKTTVIKMLSGLTRPSEGRAFVAGYDLAENIKEVKRCIAVSPQETAIAPNLTVKENLLFFAGIYGFSQKDAVSRVSSVADRLGLASVFDRRASKLSGGWQRRLSIAIALLREPKVLFLDEPTLGLDVLARSELWALIRELKGKTTIVLTTHYMEEAESLSDRVGVMQNGNMLFVGSPEEMKHEAGCERFDEAFVAIVKRGEAE